MYTQTSREGGGKEQERDRERGEWESRERRGREEEGRERKGGKAKKIGRGKDGMGGFLI